MTGYDVYRSATSGSTPSAATLVATVPTAECHGQRCARGSLVLSGGRLRRGRATAVLASPETEAVSTGPDTDGPSTPWGVAAGSGRHDGLSRLGCVDERQRCRALRRLPRRRRGLHAQPVDLVAELRPRPRSTRPDAARAHGTTASSPSTSCDNSSAASAAADVQVAAPDTDAAVCPDRAVDARSTTAQSRSRPGTLRRIRAGSRRTASTGWRAPRRADARRRWSPARRGPAPSRTACRPGPGSTG